jgi:hypothetical protein
VNTWSQTRIADDDTLTVDHKIHRAAREFVAVTISDGNHRNNIQLLLSPEHLEQLAFQLKEAAYSVYETLAAERIEAEAADLAEVES